MSGSCLTLRPQTGAVAALDFTTTLCCYKLGPFGCSGMSKFQTSHHKAGKSFVKKKKKSYSSTCYPKDKIGYCVLCRKSYFQHEVQDHVHGMLHHTMLETVLGTDSLHECQACKASSIGLKEYAEHISTSQHQAMLNSMMMRNVKPVALNKILSKETMGRILEANRTLKKERKKAVKKKKKKRKQEDGQRLVEMQLGVCKKERVVSKAAQLVKNEQVNMRMLQQETYQEGKNNAVVQNKENKVSSRQRSLHQRESTNQSDRLVCLSEEPEGLTVQDQSIQSAQQLRFNEDLSVKIDSSQTDSLVRKAYQTKRGTTKKPKNETQNAYYNQQNDGEFTSDVLPHNGAINFSHEQKESLRLPQQAQKGWARTASRNGTANAAPIRDVDVSAMLRQIRRALGVREPCRADREARRQNSEAGVRMADHSTMQQAGADLTSQVNSPAPESHSDVCHSNITPPKPKRRRFKMTQEMTQHCEKSSMVASDSNRQSPPLDSQTSPSQCPTTSSESNLNIPRKVRIAHKSGQAQGVKEAGLKPAVNTLISLSETKNKLSWRETKRMQQEKGKDMPRFGIELANPPSDQESSTQAKDNDTTLSEGFHWESFPESPSGAHLTLLPPPPQNTTSNDSNIDTQSDSPIQEPLEQPGAAQEGCSSQMAEASSVKVEPKVEDENGDWRANSSASKRKHNDYDGVSDMQPSGKKKKTKSKNALGQMDQLLAVSLREDELSHSLQDLDKSLVQARNALQAAYTEVQRLLLLRQQFTEEVNRLRAQRIEILQGMQGGYTGAEKATTSSAGAPGFPASSRQQPSPTNSASSISPFALPTMPVKQEIFQLPAAGQAIQFDKPVSCNSDTLQVPANQPVLLLPSNLLPSQRLPSPCLAAPTTQSANSDSEEETGGNLCMEQVKENEPAAEKPVSALVPQKGQIASAATPDDDEGSESDASVEMMEPRDLVVIDIDESDNEDAPNVPVDQEPPQKSVSVEFSSSCTQTFQQSDVERKVQPTLVPMKDTGGNLECVDVVEDEEPSVGAFLNHTGPVHGLHIYDGRLYTCSGDNTARAYNLRNKECQSVFEGHTNKVNCLLVSSVPTMIPRLYTGSSDQTIRCYSIKTTKCLEQISLTDRVLCLHIAWNILYAGLANGSVASHDLKNLKYLDVFECHGPRGVSCLGTAQEGARRVLLVGSYDSSISVRDAKSGLLLRSLQGHTKTVLCMKVVNDLVFSGSSDTSVHAHNIHTGELVRIYKGHGHAVTSIVILGKVMVTACLDKLVRVYELQSHDRLQVYGGHSDMVMCMAVHKSVVYTGCYDGSVQAVKLNLMKNYRCWWQNCSLIFGTAEHLLQHLVGDHSNLNLKAAKCRWRSCSTFFSTQQAVQQNLPEHMQSHVDNDSKVQP